jgi:aspartate 1-decarboxylase
MIREFMHAKLHRVTVTRADVNYVGSVSIDVDLMEAVGILPNEKVQIVNLNNGERFETYAIEAPRGSRVIGMNGGCAHLAKVGDICLIIAYAQLSPGESINARVAILGEGNEIEAMVEEIIKLTEHDALKPGNIDSIEEIARN